MKAYEYYVLLGKYKKRLLSEVEFERFVTAFNRESRFRNAFYESTGEYNPKWAPKKTRKLRRSKSRTQTKPLMAATQTTSVSAVSKTKSPERLNSEPPKDIIYHHSEFKRKQRKRKKSKTRWIRLIKHIANNHPFACFTLIILVIATAIFISIQPGYSGGEIKLSSQDGAKRLIGESKPMDTSVISKPSIVSGNVVSEADLLFAIDSSAFESADAKQSNATELMSENSTEEGLKESTPKD